MTAPTLETPRLRLRAHRREDFEPLAAIWSDPGVARFIGGKVSTREESWARLARYHGFWPLLGFGFWAVEEKASGIYVGEIGFADFHRDITPSFGATPEQGWTFAPAVHGKGYATEAGRAVLAWADGALGGPFVCMIDPDNAPSIAVARKLGYERYAETVYKAAPVGLYRRPAP